MGWGQPHTAWMASDLDELYSTLDYEALLGEVLSTGLFTHGRRDATVRVMDEPVNGKSSWQDDVDERLRTLRLEALDKVAVDTDWQGLIQVALEGLAAEHERDVRTFSVAYQNETTRAAHAERKIHDLRQMLRNNDDGSGDQKSGPTAKTSNPVEIRAYPDGAIDGRIGHGAPDPFGGGAAP